MRSKYFICINDTIILNNETVHSFLDSSFFCCCCCCVSFVCVRHGYVCVFFFRSLHALRNFKIMPMHGILIWKLIKFANVNAYEIFRVVFCEGGGRAGAMKKHLGRETIHVRMLINMHNEQKQQYYIENIYLCSDYRQAHSRNTYNHSLSSTQTNFHYFFSVFGFSF